MKRSSLLAGLLAVCTALTSMQTLALTLGRLRVLSPLGQPLNAEIDISDISPEEANSLRIAIAGPDAFKAAGLDYNPITAGITISGKRRPDGRAYLELRNTATVNDSFMDLVLEINWSTGRMVRDYTLLFDPPVGNITATTRTLNPTLPITGSAPASNFAAPSPSGSTNLGAPPTTPTDQGNTQNNILGEAFALNSFSARTGASVSAKPKNVPAQAASKKTPSVQREIVIKKGDTATTLAQAERMEGVSLDQMLVAMLKNNPDAFIDGNINRLKAGVVLEMPSQEQALALSTAGAKSYLQAQSRDFNEYRKNLANSATTTASESSKRDTVGTITAKIEDKKLNNATPDRLTLAKPNPSQKPSVEDKIAVDRASGQVADRKAELEKNIADLGKITPPASSPVAPSVAITPPVIPPVPAPVQIDSNASAMPNPAANMSATQPLQKKQDTWIDQFLNHTYVLWVAGILGLLLLIAAWIRARKRKQDSDTLRVNTTQSFAPSDHAAQTLFGAPGGNIVNTQESINSTMVYSPSQFATGTGDVDPIAEADVYLAYNRDVQAEEILKEAKQAAPKRTDVYVKLLEIYVKRHDTESFDSTAQELHLICDGEGAHWVRARELAKQIRTSSALFAVTGSSFAAAEPAQMQSAYANNSLSFTPSVQIKPTPQEASPMPAIPALPTSHLIDFDLSALTLDLPQAAISDESKASANENAKLALAEEYLSIGDKAGARGLIQEVLANESNQSVLAHAHQMLARIG